MKGRKMQRRSFRVRSVKPASPLSFIVALLLLAALGVTAWYLDMNDAPIPTIDADTVDAVAPDSGAETPADDSAGTSDETPLPTQPSYPTTIPAAPTALPTSEPAAPANPMSGFLLGGTAYADGSNASATEQKEDGSVTQTPDSTSMPAPDATVEPVPGPLAGVKIGIDPGHQSHGNNEREPVAPGSSETKPKVSSGTAGVSTRRNEYEVNLEIALILRDALQAAGAEVYMTREINDVNISNVERAQMMNELGVDVVLRLHCNGSENQSTHGIGLYVKSSGEGAAESQAICEPLIQAMGETTGSRTESIHIRDTYSGLNWSTVPSILVEMGYMSNPEEDQKLSSPEYQALLVEGMVNGLAEYYSMNPPARLITVTDDGAVGE
ncbi:MAG: N-acetylmuramoyl-L-alanine amidase [Clostridia bacterium]|nr:N-acetylmuramoyl-L-alanine amidase [Clostridia bacterium]